MTTLLHRATSADGTGIAYEQAGSGPAVILVGGAFCDRTFAAPLDALLKEHFTVVSYDRRGRGDSGDTPPYAVARELEDLAAVIAAVGGEAYLYGVSSGAILALEAAAQGLPVRKLGLVEPPYNVDGAHPIANLAAQYTELCAAGRNGEAVELFMTKVVGQPQEAVEQVRQMPMWPALEAMAPTLAYDAMITGDGVLPADRAASVTVPTLAVDSTASPEWLRQSTRTLADTVPNGEHRTVRGQFHQPDPEPLAAELTRFFLS